MTQQIAPTTSARPEVTVDAPKPREQASGRSVFELLLGMQLAAKVPEMAAGERFTEHAKAQYQRGDERTRGESAQHRPDSSHANRARSKGGDQSPGTRGTSGARGQTNPTGSMSTEARSDGAMGGKGPSGSESTGKGGLPAAKLNDDASTTKNESQSAAPRHQRGGAIAAMLAPTTATRIATNANQVNNTVSAVKTASGGGTQVGLSSQRSGGRAANVMRARPNAPANRARTFHLEQQKVLAQVGRGIAAALKREGGMVTMRLKPETLGELKIKLELNHGRVQAMFRADNDSARQLLESSFDALRSSLEAKGLRVDRLFVESPDDPGHKQNGSQSEPNDREQTPGGDRERSDDGDRPRQSPRMAHNVVGSDPQADAEAPVDQNAVSDARIAEDSTPQSGLVPGEDEMLVRVRLDAVA